MQSSFTVASRVNDYGCSTMMPNYFRSGSVYWVLTMMVVIVIGNLILITTSKSIYDTKAVIFHEREKLICDFTTTSQHAW